MENDIIYFEIKSIEKIESRSWTIDVEHKFRCSHFNFQLNYSQNCLS